MRIIAIALAAAVLAVPAMPAAAFDPPKKGERAQSWRGADGRIYCRRPNGTTGILVGRRGGAPAPVMDRRDSSSTLGAALGALLGGQTNRGSGPRCR